MHTKGKLESWGQGDFVVSLRIKTKVGYRDICAMQLAGSIEKQDVQNANAERLVKCWNEFDGLVDICERLTEYFCSNKALFPQGTLQAIYTDAKQALKQAKEIE